MVLEIVPDQNAEIVRLQAGEIDMLQQHVRAEDIATLRPLVTQNTLRLIELGVSTDPDAFFFNLRPAKWAKDPRGSWMPKREFRQAISHAVDREAFANTVYLSAAVPIWGPVSPGNTTWFSPNVPRYGFSLEKASALLAGLGLSNRDADPWLEDAKGAEARFTVLTFRGNSALERSAAVLREDLEKVGIAVDVVPLEQGTLIERMMKGDFEAIYLNLFMTSLDPALSSDYWLSSGSAHIWNIGQAAPATDWERQIDDLMKQQAATIDHNERKRIFNDVQRIFSEQLPALYFVAPRLYIAVTSRVGNLTPAVIRPQLLWAADTITVQPSASQRAHAKRDRMGRFLLRRLGVRAAPDLRRVVGLADPDEARAGRHHHRAGARIASRGSGEAPCRVGSRPTDRVAVPGRGSPGPCASTSALRCSTRARLASFSASAPSTRPASPTRRFCSPPPLAFRWASTPAADRRVSAAGWFA